MSAFARSLLALVAVALLRVASAASVAEEFPHPKDPACATLLLGKIDANDKPIQKLVAKPMRLNGVPGGGVDLTIPLIVPPTKTVIAEKIVVCDFSSKIKPNIFKTDNHRHFEAFANVKWPLSTNLIVYVTQYS